jgi:uncharacterized protein
MVTSKPKQRGWIAAAVDKLFAWLIFGLPAESSSYTVERVRIPVDQGIELVAEVLRPTHPWLYSFITSEPLKPAGTILVRTPYGLDFPMSLACRPYAARGYNVISVASRATSGSGGKFYPFKNEGPDGVAVLAWLRKQPWYTGDFATMGGSYLGLTQWALLAQKPPPPDMKAALIASGPHDFGSFAWSTGALSPSTVVWSLFMHPVYREVNPGKLAMALPKDEDVAEVLNSTPLLEGVNDFFKQKGGIPAWMEDTLVKEDQNDPIWAASRATAALDQADIPIMLSTGWYDYAVPQVLEQYRQLSSRSVNVALNIGPWNHLDAQRVPKRLEYDWLEEHYAQRPAGTKKPRRKTPVRVFVTGSQRWLDLQRWPVASKEKQLYLGPGGTLSQDEPSPPETSKSSFTFDPAAPTPPIGTPVFSASGLDGMREDDSGLAARADVLSFTTTPLPDHLDVMGRPSITLHHGTSVPFADILIRLEDVDPKGGSHNIAERYMRLPVDRKDDLLQLELSDCAHQFKKGNRVRVVLAGGSHPQYIRNFGYGEPTATAVKMRAVEHIVRHGVGAVSSITLPVAVDDK